MVPTLERTGVILVNLSLAKGRCAIVLELFSSTSPVNPAVYYEATSKRQ